MSISMYSASVFTPMLGETTKAVCTAPAALDANDGFDSAAWSKRLAGIEWAKGDAERGRVAFTKATCAACHDGGRAVGPSLLGITKRSVDSRTGAVRGIELRVLVDERDGIAGVAVVVPTPTPPTPATKPACTACCCWSMSESICCCMCCFHCCCPLCCFMCYLHM